MHFCFRTSQHFDEVTYFFQNWSKVKRNARHNDPKATFTESFHTAWTLSFLNVYPKMVS